jgi:putative oxidoreductase
MSKGKNIGLWVVQVVLAAAFLGAGGLKLAGAVPMVQLFDTIGVGQWFRYLTGALEVGSGILLLIPGMAGIAAVLLTCVMAGAILTHLTILHNSPLDPVILLLLTLVVLWGRWSQIAGRLGLVPQVNAARSGRS